MNVLVIYAHPNPRSFNHAVLEAVERGLGDGGHDFAVIDLYADRYDPVLVFDETVKRTDLDELTEAYQAMIRDADHLILVYPVWWYGLPAILKGFMDRVLTPGFAYTYENGKAKGALAGKSAWALYTMGSPGWYVTLFRRNAEWTVLRDGILRFCGVKRIKKMRFASIHSSTPGRRQRWLAYVYQQAKDGL